MKTGVPRLVWIAILLFPFCMAPSILRGQTKESHGNLSIWHDGFQRYDFIMDTETLAITPFQAPENEGFGVKDPPNGKRRCILIMPKTPAPGKPWSWRGCYWDTEPQTEIELLKHGFFIAYISASAALKPGRQWDAWYGFLTKTYGLSPRPAFIGMSRGGEYAYMWATNHPDDVCCIYADNPAANPDILDKLGGLAKDDVPLFHVCGSMDALFAVSTLPIENIYRQWGGRISVMIKEGYGHHPHSLHDPKPIADFIEQSYQGMPEDTPQFAGSQMTRSWFYSKANSYRFFTDEGAYITYRGPFFNGCYRRYLMQIPGVDAFTTVIAPRKAAVGNPWVFRADPASPGDSVNMHLLARGFYIVTGAVPYNYDGPVLAQWNAIYAYLTGFGFSKRPVMAGNGGAAGEAVAWAIENPGKVSCIYAENPILKSKIMTKTPPLEHLQPLAKADIPIFFVCGSRDPSLNDQAEEAEKKYHQLDGKITLVIEKGEGHYLPVVDPKPVLNFIIQSVKERPER